MKAWTIIGYTFDGAAYCVECVENTSVCDCPELEKNSNGLCEVNCHGCGPRPIVAIDEWLNGCWCDNCGLEIVEPLAEG